MSEAVRLSVLFVGNSGLDAGDVLIGVRVDSNGFSGAVEAWVHAGAMKAFLAALRSLHRTLEGEAILESMSPGELVLRIRREDFAGHIRVEGQIAAYGWDDPPGYDHVLQFRTRWECQFLWDLANEIDTQISNAARAM